MLYHSDGLLHGVGVSQSVTKHVRRGWLAAVMMLDLLLMVGAVPFSLAVAWSGCVRKYEQASEKVMVGRCDTSESVIGGLCRTNLIDCCNEVVFQEV